MGASTTAGLASITGQSPVRALLDTKNNRILDLEAFAPLPGTTMFNNKNNKVLLSLGCSQQAREGQMLILNTGGCPRVISGPWPRHSRLQCAEFLSPHCTRCLHVVCWGAQKAMPPTPRGAVKDGVAHNTISLGHSPVVSLTRLSSGPE